MSNDNWIEELYRYAESNIVGYKRPADYKERVKRVLNGKRKPCREVIRNDKYRD